MGQQLSDPMYWQTNSRSFVSVERLTDPHYPLVRGKQLAQKTVDPSDSSFNIQDIFNNLSGGKTGGMDLQGMLNRFGGGKLDKDGDGDVDMADLQSIFAGGGSMMDKVKGLFN